MNDGIEMVGVVENNKLRMIGGCAISFYNNND